MRPWSYLKCFGWATSLIATAQRLTLLPLLLARTFTTIITLLSLWPTNARLAEERFPFTEASGEVGGT